jgi:hypothetical protein
VSKKKTRSKSRYAAKRAARGGDSYGVWRDGRRQSPERVNGRVIS